jgi:hypothetical protein
MKQHFSNYDYLFVLDYDLEGYLYPEGIDDSLYQMETNRSIDAMSCLGLEIKELPLWGEFYHYYDSFAYRPKNSSLQYDSWASLALWHFKLLLTFHPNPAGALIPVSSAFAGFAIYRIDSINNYDVQYNYGGIACEHSYLMFSLPNCYINPRMLYLIHSNPIL